MAAVDDGVASFLDKKKSLDKETLELLTCIMHLQLALGHTKELWEGQALRSNSDF